MPPQWGKRVVRYFQNEAFGREGLARARSGCDLGGGAPSPAQVDALSLGSSALSRWPARHGPHRGTGLLRTAMSTHPPPLETANPHQSFNLSRSALGTTDGRLLDPHEEQTPILELRSPAHSDKQVASGD